MAASVEVQGTVPPPATTKSLALGPVILGGMVSVTGLVWKLCTVIDLVLLDPIFVLLNM